MLGLIVTDGDRNAHRELSAPVLAEGVCVAWGVGRTSQLKRKPDCCAGCGLSALLSAAETHTRGSTE